MAVGLVTIFSEIFMKTTFANFCGWRVSPSLQPDTKYPARWSGSGTLKLYTFKHCKLVPTIQVMIDFDVGSKETTVMVIYFPFQTSSNIAYMSENVLLFIYLFYLCILQESREKSEVKRFDICFVFITCYFA